MFKLLTNILEWLKEKIDILGLANFREKIDEAIETINQIND